MKHTLIAAFLFLNVSLHAQDTTKHTVNINTDSLTSVQVEARFPGGQDAWRAFLEEMYIPK